MAACSIEVVAPVLVYALVEEFCSAITVLELKELKIERWEEFRGCSAELLILDVLASSPSLAFSCSRVGEEVLYASLTGVV